MSRIEERCVEADGIRILVREVAGEGLPAVFVHGNPTSSADWVPFLERLEGPGLAFDLPCFGRSQRPPPGRFEPTMEGYARFVERLLAALGVERHRLVVHDWGVVALIAALRAPERLERLVVSNAVPLLPGFRWHWVARIWRRRVLGELANAAATRGGAGLLLRQARPGMRAMPPRLVDEIWDHWDRGTSRAVLRLYRSADAGALAAAGGRLDRVRCPALVLWGARDPYLPPRFARDYADRLAGAELVVLDRAGHWPWIDRPEAVDRVLEFLT